MKKLSELTWSINLFTVWKLFKRYVLRKKAPQRNFGLKPDKWDERDTYYKVRRPGIIYPSSTERRNISAFSYRYDQGDIGSCVGNGVVASFRRTLQFNEQPDVDLSRLFAYWIAREEGYKQVDSGASIRDAFKAVNKYGICEERIWPYITKRFAFEPTIEAFAEALEHQSISYERIFPVTRDSIMDALSRGFPIVYGMRLFESFMSQDVAITGKVPMPRPCREDEVGGHCKVIFDYDEKNVIELNSWGPNWGNNGTCEVPWDYILSKYCSDFWVFYKTE